MNATCMRALPVLVLGAAVLLGGCDALREVSEAEYLERAAAHRAKGSPQAAVIELKNALQRYPDSVPARLRLANTHLDMGDAGAARIEFERALARGASPAEATPGLVQAMFWQGEIDAALQVLAGAGLDAGVSDALRAQGLFARGAGAEGCAAVAPHDGAQVPIALAHAQCALHEGRPSEARALLAKTLSQAPDDVALHLLQARAALAENDLEAAEAAYTQVLQRVPGRLEARAGRTAVRLALQRLDEADADLRALRRGAPGHVIVARLEGLLAQARGDHAAAASAFERALTLVPLHAPTQLHAGLAHYAAGQHEQALQRLQQFTRNNAAPQVQALVALLQARRGAHAEARTLAGALAAAVQGDAATHATLGTTYRLLGDSAQAVEQLRRAVQAEPAAGAPRLQLASALLHTGDTAGAVAELEKAVELDSQANSVEALIQGHLAAGNYAAALSAVDRLEQDGASAAAANYRGVAHLMQQDVAQAERHFREALRRMPGHVPASLNLARVHLSRGEAAEGRALLESVVKREPRQVSALLLLAALERQAGNRDQGRAYLERAVAAAPHLADPALALARDYLALGQPERALEVATRALERQADNLGLLEVQGLAAQAARRPADAVRAFERLTALAPDSAQAHHYLARAQMAVHSATAARTSLARVLALEPDNVAALREAAALALQAGDHGAGERMGKRLREVAPEAPWGWLVQAQVRQTRGDTRAALAVLDEAPMHDGEAAHTLARMRWALGDRGGAVAAMQDWRRAHPADARALNFIAEAYLALGEEARARDAYAALVEVEPDNPQVLNNLAWLSRGSDPAAALRHAQRAVELAPSDAAVLDTYGWIRHERGDNRRARESLARAYQLAPDQALIQYHYAAVLARAGEKAQARVLLERALAGPDFSAAPEARALLESL